MPSSNSTRTAHTGCASSFRRFSACWANLGATISEVLIVSLSMAMNAKCCAIRYFKAQGWLICKWLNVMGMEISSCSTFLALEIIAFIYGASPIVKLPRQSCPCRLEACTTLPYWRQMTRLTGSSAVTRAKDSFSISARKFCFAVRTLFSFYWIPSRPTCLAAKLGALGSISMSPIRVAAGHTGEVNSFTSRQDFAAINCHGANITSLLQNIKLYPFYCDVIVQSFEDFTGRKAVLLEGA